MKAPVGSPLSTTCPYCGVGCGVIATPVQDGGIEISGDPKHPANFGRLCSKGSALAETLDLEGRLLHPEIGGRPATWDMALDHVAATFRNVIAEHGPDAVAFYVSGQMLTEDYYVANKLMKGFIGSANIDTNSRLCMASSVTGHRRAFGADVVPGTYEDLELADLIVLVGSNLAWCHPVLFQRIMAARERRPQMKIVVIDPRRTMTAEAADLHLAVRPDSDVALFNGLLVHLADNGVIDHDYVGRHTIGLDEAVAAGREIRRDDIASATGLAIADLLHFYTLFSATDRVVTVFSQGVNQSVSGTDKANAIINCHFATGRIGRPGAGPFSVTGQPNAMGGREVGGLSNMLAAHMEIENRADRERVKRFWQAPAIAKRPGLKAVDMFRAVADGRIKAIWIMATNPAVSMPDADAVKAALEACPFVVVSDVMAQTDTVRLAHVKLPAAGWGEKDGTVTNSERRISRQRPFLPLPGEARPDWWIVSEVARRMGFVEAFAYEGPTAIFSEYAALTAYENEGRRALDIGAFAGIGKGDYDAMTPWQWPRPAAGVARGSGRFFAAGGFFTPDRKARFVPVGSSTRTIADSRLTLNTGRVRDHWHTMTRTGKSPRLSGHLAEPFVELHPTDAARAGIADADIAELSNERGRVLLRAVVTDRQLAGNVFVPMHWNDEFSAAARVDVLVAPEVDPHSGQPALKAGRVEARRFAAGQYGFAVSRLKPDSIDADHWARAICEGGWRLEFARATEIEDHEDFVRTLFSVTGDADLLAYHDHGCGDHRFAVVEGGRLVGALFLARAPVRVSRSWATEQLATSHDLASSRYRIVAGRGGTDRPDPGVIVCSCFGVGVNQIAAAVTRDDCLDVDAVGRLLGAGTNCGSCRGEIKAIIDAHRVIAAE